MRLFLSLGLLVACSGPVTPDSDAGSMVDARNRDAPHVDSSTDASVADVQSSDTLQLDVSLLDAPSPDALDTGLVDAGSDAGLDAGPEFVTPEMFGAVAGEESGGAVNEALSVGLPVVMAGVYTTDEDILIPADTHVTGGGTIATAHGGTYVYLQGSRVRIEDMTFDFSEGGTMTTRPAAEGETLDDLTFQNVQFNNSQHASGIHLLHVRNVRFLQCGAENNNSKGVYVRWFEDLLVEGGEYLSNGQFGVFAADGTNATFRSITSHHNGTVGGFSGLTMTRVNGVVSEGNLTHDNGEHGESYQGVENFQIRDFVANDNDSSGINLQSDGMREGAHIPCRDGSITNGRVSSNRRSGIVLKEENVNVRIIDNFVALSPRGIHLVDIRTSLRRSTNIYFEGNTFGPRVDPVLANFVNSNGSDVSGDYGTYR